MVGSTMELHVTVTVWNEGEDSYGTVVNFYYPAGLSYRRVSGIQVTSFLDSGWLLSCISQFSVASNKPPQTGWVTNKEGLFYFTILETTSSGSILAGSVVLGITYVLV